jgi:hypothetical protein
MLLKKSLTGYLATPPGRGRTMCQVKADVLKTGFADDMNDLGPRRRKKNVALSRAAC